MRRGQVANGRCGEATGDENAAGVGAVRSLLDTAQSPPRLKMAAVRRLPWHGQSDFQLSRRAGGTYYRKAAGMTLEDGGKKASFSSASFPTVGFPEPAGVPAARQAAAGELFVHQRPLLDRGFGLRPRARTASPQRDHAPPPFRGSCRRRRTSVVRCIHRMLDDLLFRALDCHGAIRHHHLARSSRSTVPDRSVLLPFRTTGLSRRSGRKRHRQTEEEHQGGQFSCPAFSTRAAPCCRCIRGGHPAAARGSDGRDRTACGILPAMAGHAEGADLAIGGGQACEDAGAGLLRWRRGGLRRRTWEKGPWTWR